MARIALLALCALILVGAIAPAHQFSERVQAFARYGPIFHVTIIGVRFGKRTDPSDSIDHAPFSRGALDASVTQLSASTAVFPDAAEGIAAWHKAGGGVFGMPVAKAVESVAETLRRADKAKR